MISLKKDFKLGVVSLKINLLDDLWYLSHIIAPGDVVTSKTERKIKIGDDSSGNVKVVRKTLTLSLQVESVELIDGLTLRVKGVVVSDSDDVAKGSYHSFGFAENDAFTLKKSSWPKFMLDQLHDALDNTAQSVLVVVFDREQAFFSELASSGIKHLSNIKADVAKKQYDAQTSSSIFSLVVSELEKSSKKYSSFVFASPSFWKSGMEKSLPEHIRKQSVFISTNLVDASVVSSLLSRPELQNILAKQRVSKEQQFIDVLLEKLSKDEVVYGVKDLEEAALSGAISSLGVSHNFIKKSQEDGSYAQVDILLKAVDSAKGSVHIIQSPDLIKVVDGLGGIAGITRWKVQ